MEESGKEKDPLGILSKEPTVSSNDSDPLGILKKKSPESTPSTLVSEGGSSGLITTHSESSSIPNEAYTVKPGTSFNPFSKSPNEIKGQTALGNKTQPSFELKSVGTSLGGQSIVADSNIARTEAKVRHDAETKSMVDVYDKYKQTKSSEQLASGKTPFALDDNKNTIDFYMSHLKETNPEEYTNMIQKQESLSKDKKAHQLAGQPDDIEEDDLMIQKSHAELLQKALALKTRVMSGKYDLASNALKDNYSDVIKNANESITKAKDLSDKIQGIDNFLKQNYQFDENGQILTNAANKKEVEDIINNRNELINEHNIQSENIKNIQSDSDFNDALSLLDDTQKTYDSLEKTYTDIKNKNPDAFNGLPTYKKQLLKQQQDQFSKDISEASTGGDLGITEGTGRGATGIVSALSFIPKSLSPNSNYGWTDKLYDVVKSNVDDFDAENNPLPTGYDKPVYENGEWNLKYLPGKIAGTLTEMAPIIAITAATEGATAGLLARMGASGELGTTLGSFAGEYAAVANDFYDEAKSSGMSEKEAMSFSRNAATTQAVLGALSPDIKLARRNAFKEGLDTYTKQIAKGVSVKDAIKESSKGFAEKLIKEVPQENLQTWAEIQDKNDMYEKMGLNEKIQKSVKKDLIETTILSSLVTLGLGLNGIATPSRMQKESLFMAASQPEEIMKSAQNMLNSDKISQQEFDDITMKVAKANFALSKMDKSLSAEQKSKSLIPLMEKLDLKEEASKLDDSQKELMNEKIAKKDAEIKGIVSSPSDEEIQDAHDAESFFNRIKDQHTKDNTPNQIIPSEENKMQKEGLFEVDSSQKSHPIELSTQPENAISEPSKIVEEPVINQKNSDDKIAELEKAIDDNKKNFFNEKIDNKTYWKNRDALESDLYNLKNHKSEQNTTLTSDEIKDKQTATAKDIKPLEQKAEKNDKEKSVKAPSGKEVDSSGILQAQGSVKEEKAIGAKTTSQISAEQEMLDEEDVIDHSDNEDVNTIKKMNDDAEIIKGFSKEKYQDKSSTELKDLVEKKYIGTLERAYKAKIDGKISKSTYTEYRNKINDIITGKLAEYSDKKTKGNGAEAESLRKGELKAQVSALGEKVKEKLLGQGLKDVALSSAVPVTPKMIEDLVNLTVKGVHLGIDIGYGVREATDRALTAIKYHPKYQQMSKMDGFDAKKFNRNVISAFSKVKSDYTAPVTQDEKVTQKPESSTKNESETSQSNKEKPLISEDDIQTGKTEKRKGTERLEANSQYDNIIKSMSEEDKNYSVMSLDKLYNSVKEKISEFEKAGLLDQLANDVLNKEKSKNISPVIMPELLSQLGDKFNALAEIEQNEFIKQKLHNISAALFADKGKIMTTSSQVMNAGRLAAERMPTSEAGIKSFVKEKMDQVHDQAMSEKNKSDIEKANKELVDLQVKQELDKIAEATKGKEQAAKIKTKLSSLKIDLSEC